MHRTRCTQLVQSSNNTCMLLSILHVQEGYVLCSIGFEVSVKTNQTLKPLLKASLSCPYATVYVSDAPISKDLQHGQFSRGQVARSLVEH
jgi:hypothetical protein